MKFATIVLALLICFSTSVFAQDYYYNIPESDILAFDSKIIADFLNEYDVFFGGINGYLLSSNVTRAEAVTLLVRLSGITPESTESIFSDVPAAHWASTHINYAKNQEIASGINETEFAPSRNVTGVEFAKMALSMLGYKELTIDNTLEIGKKCQLISNKYLEKITSDYVLKRNDVVIYLLAMLNTENSDGILQKDLFVERKDLNIEKFDEDIAKANEEVVFLSDFVCTNMMQFRGLTADLWYFCIDKNGRYYVASGTVHPATVIYNDPVTGKQISDFIPKKNNLKPDDYFVYTDIQAEMRLTKKQLINIKHFIDEVLANREYILDFNYLHEPPRINSNICGNSYKTYVFDGNIKEMKNVNTDLLYLQNELIGLSPIKVKGWMGSLPYWMGFDGGYESGELLN